MTTNAENNVVSFLARAASRVGNRVALAAEDERGNDLEITFAQLWRRASKISAGLISAGLAPGDRAIMMIPMSIDLYVVLLGLIKLGGVGVFIDPWMPRRQIVAFAEFANPKAFIGVPRSHLLRLIARPLRQIPISITTGRRWLGLSARYSLATIEANTVEESIAQSEADDPALITFTSGSGGVPKGANRTHGFLTAQHRALSRAFPYRDTDIEMTMFPVFALNNLAAGITTIIPKMDFRHVSNLDAPSIGRQMIRHKVTTATASPIFFDRLTKWQQDSKTVLPLRRIITGGAPVSDRQLQNWRVPWPGTETLIAYGSTEAEPVAQITADQRLAASADPPRKASGVCVGRPTELIRAKLVRIQSDPIELPPQGWPSVECPPGEIGELVVAGEHVCRDYYRNPVAVTANKIVEHQHANGQPTVWHRMGDTGYFDKSGRFWLVGRVHSTIVRDGDTIHPQLVEQAAAGDDHRISQVAAVGMPDAKFGQRLVVVIFTDETATDVAELKADVRNRLSEADIPCDEIVISTDPLPVDPRHNAKIDYQQLQADLLRR